jgi:MFS transporter, MHS family, shikimate and dehydroshikimate transport protein
VERLSGEHMGRVSSIRQVAIASLVGTALEWYDYFLYGTAAALIFNELFFPEADPLMGTLLAFATFGVGFGTRPIGGLVFGHFGDKIGRKGMLVITLMIMGLATFAIGLMPTYDAIGVWAPILLVALRLIQGFGVGGEWGGAVLMAVEHAPTGRRGFYGSWPQMGVPAGLVLSTVVFAAFEQLPEQQFMAWGWRVPFLLSIVLVAVGLYIRLRLMESPAFREVEETHTEAPMPILDVLRTYPKNVILAMGARVGDNMLFYIFTVFVLTYVVEELGLSESLALVGVSIAAFLEFFAIPFFGWLSDRIGRRPVYIGGALFCILFAFPYFWLMNTEVRILVWLAIVLSLVIGHAAMYAPRRASSPSSSARASATAGPRSATSWRR